MSFWATLFGTKQTAQAPAEPVTSTPLPKPAPAPSKVENDDVILTRGNTWYVAADKSRCLRQVVLLSDPTRKSTSRFATLFLCSQYSDLITNAIAPGFFRLDDDPGPFLMIRTDGTRDDGFEAVDGMAEQQYRIAFNFARLPTSGLLSVFVCSEFVKNYSRRGYLEIHYGMDLQSTRNLLSDAFQRDQLHIVHARGHGAGSPPTAKYDVTLPIDSACRQALADEWKSLVSHHTKIVGPNYQSAVNQIYQLFPDGENPILSPTTI